MLNTARSFAGLAISLALIMSGAASAQTPSAPPPAAQPPPPAQPEYHAPRTSFGDPSLEGVWTHNFVVLMEATSNAPLVLPEEAATAMAAQVASGFARGFDQQLDPEVPALMRVSDGFPIVRGQRRTRTVVQPADGKIPMTPEARAEGARYGSTRYDNPEQRPNWERCITSLGLPPVTGVATTSANPRMIVQTPGAVVIYTEYGGEARIIPITGKHNPRALASPLGDSIARWEGETLVVETIHQLESDRVRAFSNLVAPADSKVIERFTRVSDRELLYQYTIENPAVYTAPWLAEYSLYPAEGRLFEHACHEGNYSLPNILRAARVAEERQVAAPQR
jgi:hypothetical protein